MNGVYSDMMMSGPGVTFSDDSVNSTMPRTVIVIPPVMALMMTQMMTLMMTLMTA